MAPDGFAQYFLFRIPALLLAIGLHEYAHAWTAWKLGDDTPLDDGRVSLNPLDHLDPLGTLMLLFAPFGWGRAVRVMPSAFRNERQDHVIVALAGPLANFTVGAIALLVVLALYGSAGDAVGPWGLVYFDFLSGTTGWQRNLAMVLNNIVLFNMCVGCFNLIPVPPLDGFTVARTFVSAETAGKMEYLEATGQGRMLFFAMLFTGAGAGAIVPGVVVIAVVMRWGWVPGLWFAALVAATWQQLGRIIAHTRQGLVHEGTLGPALRRRWSVVLAAGGAAIAMVALAHEALDTWNRVGGVAGRAQVEAKGGTQLAPWVDVRLSFPTEIRRADVVHRLHGTSLDWLARGDEDDVTVAFDDRGTPVEVRFDTLVRGRRGRTLHVVLAGLALLGFALLVVRPAPGNP